jgi:hypothetical protein
MVKALSAGLRDSPLSLDEGSLRPVLISRCDQGSYLLDCSTDVRPRVTVTIPALKALTVTLNSRLMIGHYKNSSRLKALEVSSILRANQVVGPLKMSLKHLKTFVIGKSCPGIFLWKGEQRSLTIDPS